MVTGGRPGAEGALMWWLGVVTRQLLGVKDIDSVGLSAAETCWVSDLGTMGC